MNITSSQWTLWALLGVGALSATGMAAYEVTIKNATKQEIRVTIDQVVCSPIREFPIQAGETKTIGTGICCSKKVTVTGSGMSATYTPPLILGAACRAYSITVSMKKPANTSGLGAPTAGTSMSGGYLVIEEGILDR
jgi:hypothetical protein